MDSRIFKYKISLLIASFGLFFSGCKNKNISEETEISSDSTSEECAIETGNLPYDENVPISKLDCELKNHPYENVDGLYLFTGLDTEDEFMIDYKEYGDKMLVSMGKYEDDISFDSLYMLDIKDNRVVNSFSMPEGASYGKIYTSYDGKLIYYLAIKDEKLYLVELDSNLNKIKDIELGFATFYSYAFSENLKNVYYFDEEANKILVCDVEKQNISQILSSVTEISNCIQILFVSEVEDLIVIKYNVDGLASYVTECRKISNGEVIWTMNQCVEEMCIKEANYLLRYFNGACNEILTGNIQDNSFAKSVYFDEMQEFDLCDIDINRNRITSLCVSTDGNDNAVYVNLYDTVTGEKINDISFNVPYYKDSYYFGEGICSVNDDEIVVLCYNGQGYFFYVWDLNANIKNYSHESVFRDYSLDGKLNKKSKERLLDKAREIERNNGIKISFGEDVENCFDSDSYSYNYVTSPTLIEYVLNSIEETLELYPNGMLAQIKDDENRGLHLYLCGEIIGNEADENTVETADGLYSINAEGPCILLNINSWSSICENLNHELCHAIEGYIELKSNWQAFEDWNTLNPDGFSYDYNYRENVFNDNFDYVLGLDDEAYFIDTYSKSYETEDRARTMEYALSLYSEKVNAFESEHLKDKLIYFSEAIRDYFDTTGWPAVTAWEAIYK